MIVCWLTLQIFAASPVVKTVFIVSVRQGLREVRPARAARSVQIPNRPWISKSKNFSRNPLRTQSRHSLVAIHLLRPTASSLASELAIRAEL